MSWFLNRKNVGILCWKDVGEYYMQEKRTFVQKIRNKKTSYFPKVNLIIKEINTKN